MLETLEVPELLDFEKYLEKLRHAGYLIISQEKVTKEVKKFFNQKIQQKAPFKFFVSQMTQSFFSSSMNDRIHGYDYNISAFFEFLLLDETRRKLTKVGEKEGLMLVSPLSYGGNFLWIYAREIEKKLYCHFNTNKDGNDEIKFGGEWKTVHFKQIINQPKNQGGAMLEIKEFRCLPFTVTSYHSDINHVINNVRNCGVKTVINKKKLAEISRHESVNRVINPFLFKKKSNESLVKNLIKEPLSHSHIWDFDAMCLISQDLALSEDTSPVQYVSLIPTFNGKAGAAVCTVDRSEKGVELGLYSSEECETMFQNLDHPIYGEVIAFANK